MDILSIKRLLVQSDGFTHEVIYSEPEVTGNAWDWCLVKGETKCEALVDFLQKRVIRIEAGEPILPISITY